MLDALKEVFNPQYCCGCNQFGRLICGNCIDSFIPTRITLEGQLQVSVVAAHNPVLLRAVRMWKDFEVLAFSNYFANFFITTLYRNTTYHEDLIFTTPPPHRQSLRLRGHDILADVARKVAREFPRSSHRQIFRYEQERLRQRQVHYRDRKQNIRGTIQLVERAEGYIVLLDDVMTSGATLSELSRVSRGHFDLEALVLTSAKALTN